MLEDIYVFADRLGKEMTDPVGICRDLPQFRMLDMFTACTHPTVKESILHSLPDSNGSSYCCNNCIWHGPGFP